MNPQEVQPLLKVQNLTKCYARKKLGSSQGEVRSLNDVCFSILPGTTLAVVGESGSGKSTLAFCLACLEYPTSGNIWFEGRDLVNLTEKDRRAVRPKIQLIFQDPANSLNPRWSLLEILSEPLILQGRTDRNEIRRRAHTQLEKVGLSPDMEKRSPAELSGGQRQRLAIARALSIESNLLILDEALSALDCLVQAQIANLLKELQSSLELTYLFITHDLAMAAHLADEIAVMNRGRIVEQGPTEEVLRQPQHETTRQLLAAMPKLYRKTLPAEEP